METYTQYFPEPSDELPSLEKDFGYQDFEESAFKILIHYNKFAPRIHLSDEIFEEIEKYDRTFRTNFSNKIREGSAGYPRVIKVPYLKKYRNLKEHEREELITEVSHNLFGLSFIHSIYYGNSGVREYLKEFSKLRENFSLIALAVKIALIYSKIIDNREKIFLIFQKRDEKINSMYQGAWDVSAGGYISEAAHTIEVQDQNTGNTVKWISPWKASLNELEEELNINGSRLPDREHYFFFGYLRNKLNGSIDIVGVADARNSEEISLENIKEGLKERERRGSVLDVDECEMEPGKIADFIIDKHYWNPKAIILVMLLLEFIGYDRNDIIKIFKNNRVFERVEYRPFL